ETPEIFFEIQRRGPVSADEMVRVFNCGLGLTLALEASRVDEALDVARARDLDARVVGVVREGEREVVIS
ncbi:MAG: phosphoribosylformylglycinamidine cyclo-ligase, partial [Acidobacteriota bacterium]|nr:phosphoribosylformylglycinamidine cyclo-ligase [Acidobacteriota bacterium]